MNRSDFQEVKEIFGSLLALSPGERTLYLDKRFSNRSDIRSEVEHLLDSYDNEFLEDPAIGFVADQIVRPSLRPGQILGQYKLRRVIGEGGMGVVYEAEQRHPKRLVAVKLIRDGIHAAEYHVKLFEREIQALARLRHSGIAPIYESGLSDDGRIYFAMELVQGTKLIDFVKRRTNASGESALDIRERLLMFRKICEAVSYAHQRGVVHRDLKPDNILVTNDLEEPSLGGKDNPRVSIKILDFGLARIMEPDVADTTELSRSGEIKGTLQYMSPEQVRGNPLEIDLRTDIYSLGVLLYEMLFEDLPYHLKGVSMGEAIRIICEQQPASVPGSLSATTGSGNFRRKIDSDVETIAHKALAKEPQDRYQSVAALADDIDRYLTNEPILARPPSAVYQFRKLVARHRTAFASLALVFLMLLGFGVVMAAQSARLAVERDRAIQAEVVAGEQTGLAEKARQDEQSQRRIAEDNLMHAEQQRGLAEREKLSAEKAREAEREQRHIAETNFRRAEEEQNRAEEQRSLADEQRTLAEQRTDHTQRLLYVSQINLAQQAWEDANISEMEVLLTNQIPKPGQKDLRGFEWYYLWRLCHRDEMTFKGLAKIHAAAFSPDGDVLAIGGSDEDSKELTKIIEVETGSEVDSIPDRVGLGFAPDGKIITVGKWSQEQSPVEFWDRNTRRANASGISVQTYLAPFLSNDGVLLASQGRVPQARNVHNLQTRNKLVSHKSTLATFQMVAFSADNNLMASADIGKVAVFDMTSGTQQGGIETRGLAFAVAFTPDNRLLAVGNDDKVIFWDVVSKQIVTTLNTVEGPKPLGAIHYLRFSPDGQLLATTVGRTVELWKVDTGKKIFTLAGHGGPVTSILFSPNGKRLASVSQDGMLKLWTLPDLTDAIAIERQFGDAISLEREQQAAISSDNRLLATVNRDRELLVRDSSTYEPAADWPQLKSEQGRYLTSPQFSSGGKILAVQAAKSLAFQATKSLEFWDVAGKSRLGTLEKVTSFAFSSHAKVVAVLTDENVVEVRELPSLSVLRTLRGDRWANLAISPDGTRLILMRRDILELVDLQTGEHHKMTIKDLDGSAAFSPDSKKVAFSAKGKITLLDFVSRAHVATLGGRFGNIASLAFSPDGKRLASVASSIIRIDAGKIRVWDLSTNQILLTFHDSGSTSAVFNSTGTALISSGGQGTRIRIAAPVGPR